MNVWYYLKNRFIRRHHLIDTHLPRGQWYDTDTRMLHGLMGLLVEYVKEERAFEIIDWDADPDHARARDEIRFLLAWWNNYDNRKQEIEDALNAWHAAKFGDGGELDDWLKTINEPDTLEVKKLFDRLHELEKKLLDEEEEMMIRLVKIRGYLWV